MSPVSEDEQEEEDHPEGEEETQSQFMIVNPLLEGGFAIDFAAIVEIVKGTSIVSLAAGGDFFELGLSENFNLRIEDIDGLLRVLLLSTLNRNEIPARRIRIISDEEQAEAGLVERRIWSLRQLYAIAFFLTEKARNRTPIREQRIRFFVEQLQSGTDAETLLDFENRLYVVAAGSGSLWLTVLTKTVAAQRALLRIISSFYSEGREALLRRVRAETVLRELEVDQKRADLNLRRAGRLIEIAQKIEKIKDPHMRESLQHAFSSNLSALGQDPTPLLAAPNKRRGRLRKR